MNIERPYQEINKRISHNIINLFTDRDTVTIDECLIAVWEALVFLDANTLTTEEKKKKHISSFLTLLNRKKIITRYQNYTKEALHEALKKERLTNLQDEEDQKCLYLSDLKIIDNIDEQGNIHLNETLAIAYNKIEQKPLKFGIMPYSGDGKKGTRNKCTKEKLTAFHIDTTIEQVLTPYIEDYCAHWDYAVEEEHYKWDAVKAFQNTFNIGAKNLGANIKEAMSPADNLLAGPFYYPLSMLVQMANFDSERTRKALRDLFEEGNCSIGEKVDKFIEETNNILEEGKKDQTSTFKANDKSMQSLRSVSVYLSLNAPASHYLYKQSVYYDFLSITGVNLPRLTGHDYILNTYETICDAIRELLLKNEELIKKHKTSYPDDVSNFHLLTQDFLYYCACHYQTIHKL